MKEETEKYTRVNRNKNAYMNILLLKNIIWIINQDQKNSKEKNKKLMLKRL